MGRTKRAGVVAAAALLATLLSACGGADEEESTTDSGAQGEVPSESTSASPSDGAEAERIEITRGQLMSGLAEEGVTYWIHDATVVQRDGEDMEVTYSVAESSSGGMPANWSPPYLVLTLEDGVTPDDLGIARVSDGWIDTGDMTFRVTDPDSEPPTAVLLTFEPT